jgi:hypothetical protein
VEVEFVRSALKAGIPPLVVLEWAALRYGWAALQMPQGSWLVATAPRGV